MDFATSDYSTYYGVAYGYATISVRTPGITITSASGSPNPATTVNTVQFSVNASENVGSAAISYLWHFGDGVTSTLQNPTHQYTSAGSFPVSVTASDAAGHSASQSFTETVTSVPPVPTNLTATAGNAQVSLTWTASAGATNYKLYRGTSAGGEGATPVATGLTGTSYTDTGLTNGTTYYYKLTAVNNVGESAKSLEASATPFVPLPAPTNLTVWKAAAGPTSVSAFLSWDAVTGATGYKVERSTDNTNWTQIGTATTNYYPDYSISASTPHYYRVRAYDANGNSGYSNVVSIDTVVPYLEATSVSWSPNPVHVGDQVQFSAVIKNDSTVTILAGHYSVEFEGDMGEAAFAIPNTDLAPGQSTTVIGNFLWTATPGPHYFAAVFNDAYVSLYGYFTVIPSAPTNLMATPGNSQVSLTWTGSSGATSYNLYRGTSAGGESTTPVATGLTGTSYTDTGLTNGTTYYYKLTAVNAGGESAQSNEAVAVPDQSNISGTAPGAPYTFTFLTADGLTLFTRTVTPATDGSFSVSVPAGSYRIGIKRWPWLQKVVTADTTNGNVSGLSFSFQYAGDVNEDGVIDGADISLISAVFRSRVGEANWNPAADVNGDGVINGADISVVSANFRKRDESLAPPAPTNLVATAGNGQVALTWTATAWTASYKLYRGTSAGGEDATPVTTGLTGTSYTDTGLTNGTTYYYKLTAVNAAGESTPSTEASATPTASTSATPIQLVAQAAGTQVSLSWNSVSGATGYNIYRATTPGGENTTVYATLVEGDGTWYADTAVTNSVTYYYKVTATYTGSESAPSNEASATPGSTPLPAPILKGVAGNGQATLTWSAVTGATSYNLYRYVSGDEDATLYRQGLTTTTFTDTGLTNGTAYSYYVCAVDKDGEGNPSIGVSLTPGSPALAAPLLSASTTSYLNPDGTGNISLTWTAVPGATQYDLYRSTTPGGEGAVPYLTNVYSGDYYPYYQDENLPAGTTYYYQVVAVGPGGEGAASNEASATVAANPLPAPILKGVAGNGQVTLTWSAVPGATSYNLYRSGSYGEILYKQGLTATTFTDTGLTNGTAYSYHVCAVNQNGEGSTSNEVLLTPGSPALAAPLLSASTTSYLNPDGTGNISLTWTAVPGATQYDLYRSTTPGGEGNSPYKTNISDSDNYGILYTDFQDENLPAGTTYYYQVVAVGPGGEGILSNEASATVGANPLPAPTTITATAAPNNGQSIAVSWSAVTGATSYNLYRSMYGDYYGGTLYKRGLTSTTFTDTNILFGPTYTYYVCAVNTSGEGTPSNTASATLYGFGIAASPTPITIPNGTIGAVAITVTPSGGYTDLSNLPAALTGIGIPVALTGTGLPNGVTAWFYPPSVTLPTVNDPPWQAGLPSQSFGGAVSSNLFLAVPSSAPHGTYNLQITGTSTSGDNFTNTTTVTLTIN